MRFAIGDRVEVIDIDEPCLRDLIGQCGTVVTAPDYDDDFYVVAIDGDDEYEFYGEELEYE